MTTTLLSPRFSNSLRLRPAQRMPIGLDPSSHSVIPMLSLPVSLRSILVVPPIGILFALSVILAHAGDPVQSPNYQLAKRTTVREGEQTIRSISTVEWEPRKVAVIVCDVWDYHHCVNAVRRLDEMLPTMDALLRKMRADGSIVIHAPSDCMPHYETHPARQRAVGVAQSELPQDIASWNCKLEREIASTYPIDQADGGEDDDPEEHKAWATKLQSLGRNPSMPWKTQNPAINIDETTDYVSDRGDEVWAILKHQGIEHVVMLGVHTNMCVLGRPFGLRQMARNGMDVVLVRDLTDCMYNPKRWPYVDHYSGNDFIISYVEQAVCPTITSDQILGGRPVEFSQDRRPKKDLLPNQIEMSANRSPHWELIEWKTVSERWLTPLSQSKSGSEKARDQVLLRCSVRIAPAAFEQAVILFHPRIKKAWLNGHVLSTSKSADKPAGFQLRAEDTFGNDDANVLVIELDIDRRTQIPIGKEAMASPMLFSGERVLTLGDHWQWNLVPSPSDTNLPLPAKFALPPAVCYSLDLSR